MCDRLPDMRPNCNEQTRCGHMHAGQVLPFGLSMSTHAREREQVSTRSQAHRFKLSREANVVYLRGVRSVVVLEKQRKAMQVLELGRPTRRDMQQVSGICQAGTVCRATIPTTHSYGRIHVRRSWVPILHTLSDSLGLLRGRGEAQTPAKAPVRLLFQSRYPPGSQTLANGMW